MVAIVQRVKEATVETVKDSQKGINEGLLVLLGITQEDNIDDVNYCVNKVLNLRIFDDQNGIMNLSIVDNKGSILSISQFTLLADISKGNRPSYINAANKEMAYPLYEKFNQMIESRGINIVPGYFGEEMFIKTINHGPVTIIINSKERK